MPIYEYRCKKCDNVFELMRRLAARDEKAPCPQCKSRATRRIEMQPVAIITGARPDAMMGEGEPEDFLDGGDFGGHGHDHGHSHGFDDFDDDF